MEAVDMDKNDDSFEAMDAQIRVLEVQLAMLKERRNHRASPLCYLPEEIVAQILAYAQESFELEIRRWVTDILPLCRRIRSIAPRWPFLWSMHYINSSDREREDEEDGPSSEPSNKLGDRPWLSLCLKYGPKTGLRFRVDNGFSNAQAERISQHARCLILDWDARGSSLAEIGGLSSNGTSALQWHLLRELEIRTHPKHEYSARIEKLIPRQSHDSLTTLQLMRGPYRLDGVPSLPQLQFLELRNVEIDPCDDVHLRRLFCEAKQLVHCMMHITWDSDTTPWTVNTNGSRMIMPQLRKLDLWGRAIVLWPLFDMFPDPREELELHITDHADETSDEQEQVIDRALAFLSDQATITRRPIEYEIDFSSGDWSMHFALQSCILPNDKESYTPLTLHATCKHRATLAKAMQYAKSVIFHG